MCFPLADVFYLGGRLRLELSSIQVITVLPLKQGTTHSLTQCQIL